MANKFLDNLVEEERDLKKIRNTLEKIYQIEVKEEKREALTQKRNEQKEKRSKGDKKISIKEMLGVTKKDEKKAKKGLLGMLGGLFKSILGMGAKPLLALAGIGLVGGAITAYIKSEKFREGVNEHVFKPLMELIKDQLPEIMRSAVLGIAQGLKIVGNPDRSENPQQESPGTTTIRETTEAVEKFFGRQKISQKTRESRAIRQSMRYQDHHYGQGLLLPGGIDEVDRKLQNFYRKGQTQIDSHLSLLSQMDNMDGQLQNLKRAMLSKDGDSPTYKKYTKQIVDLEANMAIKSDQILESEHKLKILAKEEASLKEYERDAMGASHQVHPAAFAGSSFVKKQTGGVLTPEEFTKKRPGNGPPSEDTIAQGVIPVLHRQKGGKVFLHWAASGYKGASGNYHATVQGDGKIVKTRDYNTFGGAHTYGYNSQGIGISLAAMAGASPTNFGNYPVKPIQYENMAKLTAQILTDWGHGASYVNDKTVPTHAEAGRDNPGDNYGPVAWGGDGNKWDLWKLYENDATGSGGPKIRNMIKRYMSSSGGNIQLESEDSTGSTGTTSQSGVNLSQTEQASVQNTIKAATSPWDMMKNLGTALSGIGGKIGSFVGGALTATADTFGETMALQSGGFVGNHKVAYDGLKKRFPEAKPHHVVGAMANFETEAPGIKPDTYQLKGGPGRGIAQWEVPHPGNPTGRWSKAEQMYGKGVIKSLPQQLDFVKWEMNTGHPLPDGRPNLPWGRNAKKQWLNSKTTSEATKNFLEGYEAPSIPHMDRRLANARKFNNQAAIEESRKSGSGPAKAKQPKKLFGLFNNGGVVGMSQNYHLNNLMEQMDTGPIMVPIPVSAARTGVSTPGAGVGPSSGGTSSNDSYRISMGAAYS